MKSRKGRKRKTDRRGEGGRDRQAGRKIDRKIDR